MNELESSIESILKGVDINQCNQFLMEFSLTFDAWGASVQLLQSSSNRFVQYICCNIIYTKIRKQFDQLDTSSRNDLLMRLITMLSTLNYEAFQSEPGFSILFNRLVMTVATICVQIAQGIEIYFSAISNMFNSENLLSVGLIMISTLPDEIESADVSRALRSETLTKLQNYTPQIFQLVDNLINSQRAIDNTSTLLIVVECIKNWVKLSSSGITLTNLFTDYQSCFQLICRGFSFSSSKILSEISACITILLNVSEFPPNTSINEAKLQIFGAIIASRSQIINTLLSTDSTPSDVNVIAKSAFVNLLNIFITKNISLLASHELLDSCFQILQVIIQSKPRSLMTESFDLWVELEDIALANNQNLSPSVYVIISQQAIPDTFRILINHCILPAELDSLESIDDLNEECDELFHFRDIRLGLDEVLTSCLSILKSQFFQILLESINGINFNDSLSIEQRNSFEVVLFILQMSMPSIKQTVLKSISMSSLQSPSDTVVVSMEEISVLKVLENCLMIALHFCFKSDQVSSIDRNKPSYLVILGTICRYIGSVTFLVTESRSFSLDRTGEMIAFNSYLRKCIELVFQQSLSLDSIKMEDDTFLESTQSNRLDIPALASKSFQQLTTYGIQILIHHESTESDMEVKTVLINLIESFLNWLAGVRQEMNAADSTPTGPVKLVVECITKVIVRIPENSSNLTLFESRLMYFQLLIQSLLELMGHSIGASFTTATSVAPSSSFLEGLPPMDYVIQLLGLILEFCDFSFSTRHVTSTDTLAAIQQTNLRLIGTVLNPLWVLIQNIDELCSSFLKNVFQIEQSEQWNVIVSTLPNDWILRKTVTMTQLKSNILKFQLKFLQAYLNSITEYSDSLYQHYSQLSGLPSSSLPTGFNALFRIILMINFPMKDIIDSIAQSIYSLHTQLSVIYESNCHKSLTSALLKCVTNSFGCASHLIESLLNLKSSAFQIRNTTKNKNWNDLLESLSQFLSMSVPNFTDLQSNLILNNPLSDWIVTVVMSIVDNSTRMLEKMAIEHNATTHQYGIRHSFIQDPDLLHQYFLMNQTILAHYDIISMLSVPSNEKNSSTFEIFIQLTLLSLSNHQLTSRDIVRTLFQNTQKLFQLGSPSSPYYEYQLQVGSKYGQEYTRLLWRVVKDGQYESVMMPLIADCLLKLITDYCLNYDVEHNPEIEQKYLISSQMYHNWLRYAIDTATNNTNPVDKLSSNENKVAVYELLMNLAMNRNKKFKSLILDLYKIFSGQITEDCLVAYYDT